MRATVTAGLAKAVELVNHMAAVICAPTAAATVAPAWSRTDPQITASSPKVATNSESQSAGPMRSVSLIETAGSSNTRLAPTTPATVPTSWATT